MVRKLYWDGGLGGARKDNTSAIIRNKPTLSFQYDALLYDDARATYQLGGSVLQMTNDQVKECAQYVDDLLLSARIGGTAYESALSQAAEAVPGKPMLETTIVYTKYTTN